MVTSPDVQLASKRQRNRKLPARLSDSSTNSLPVPIQSRYESNSVSPGLISETESAKAFALAEIDSNPGSLIGSVQSSVEPSSSLAMDQSNSKRGDSILQSKGKGRARVIDSEEDAPLETKKKKKIIKITRKIVNSVPPAPILPKPPVIKKPVPSQKLSKPLAPKKKPLDSDSDDFDSLFAHSRPAVSKIAKAPLPSSSPSATSSEEYSDPEDGVKKSLKKKSPLKRGRKPAGKIAKPLPDWTRGIGESESSKLAASGSGNRKRRKEGESGSDINSDATKAKRSREEDGMRRVLDLSSDTDDSDEDQPERRKKRAAEMLKRKKREKSRSLTPPAIVVKARMPVPAVPKVIIDPSDDESLGQSDRSSSLVFEISTAPSEPERIITINVTMARDPTKTMSAKAVTYYETPIPFEFSSKKPFSALAELVAERKNLVAKEVVFTYHEARIYGFGTGESLKLYLPSEFRCFTKDIWEKTVALKAQKGRSPSHAPVEAEKDGGEKENSPVEEASDVVETVRVILRTKSKEILILVKKSMKISSILKVYFKREEIVDEGVKANTWLEFDGEKLDGEISIGEVEDFEDEEFIDVRSKAS